MRSNVDNIVWAPEPGLLVEQALFHVTDYKHDLRTPEWFQADIAGMLQEMGGAIIDFAVSEIGGMNSFTILSKVWLNSDKDDLRKVYTGTIGFPLKEGCYQIKAMGLEQSPTGVRESVVAMSLITKGKLSLPKGNMHAAMADKTLGQAIKDQPMVRAPADDAKYDKDFASHPLTRVRATLQRIRESLTYEETVKNSQPYRVQDSVNV